MQPHFYINKTWIPFSESPTQADALDAQYVVNAEDAKDAASVVEALDDGMVWALDRLFTVDGVKDMAKKFSRVRVHAEKQAVKATPPRGAPVAPKKSSKAVK